jgi:type III secretion system FlhB-like substrate exporter
MSQQHKKYMDKYKTDYGNEDLTHYAKNLIEKAEGEGIAVTADPDKLKHMVNQDVRDMLPPQLYEVIGLIATAIEKASEEDPK